MKRAILFFAAARLCSVAFSAPPDVKDRGDMIEVRNAHYAAVLVKSKGGVLASLASADGKVLLADHRIYTDFGFYPKRGHVGTRNETNPTVTIKRGGDAATVSSMGMLRGTEAEERELIQYKLTYRFDASPGISAECEAVPLSTEPNTRAWLATCFAVPSMREWAVNTIDGVIREDVREGGGRSYEAVKLWIDSARPDVGFITTDGRSLLVTDIACRGPNDLQNIIIHGKTFFLAWYAGGPARIDAAPHRLTFRLFIGRGDPFD